MCHRRPLRTRLPLSEWEGAWKARMKNNDKEDKDQPGGEEDDAPFPRFGVEGVTAGWNG